VYDSEHFGHRPALAKPVEGLIAEQASPDILGVDGRQFIPVIDPFYVN
jgi:hypothetical protein